MKIQNSRKTGFTLIEIMIVVGIVGLLAAIAIPNFYRARQVSRTNACINNLRQIDSAKHQWALENGQKSSALPTSANLTPYIGRNMLAKDLYCPLSKAQAAQGMAWAGYSSSIGAVGALPSCANYNPSTHKASLDPLSQ